MFLTLRTLRSKPSTNSQERLRGSRQQRDELPGEFNLLGLLDSFASRSEDGDTREQTATRTSQ
jgi:hypothetical protein